MAGLSGAHPLVGALGKHLALIGFMGAGKSTIGRDVARLTDRPFIDTDQEIEKRHGPIPALFERGEAEFRRLEELVVAEALAGPPSVLALGGGAVLSPATQERLRAHAFSVWIEVDPDDAWRRSRASDRPLAREEQAFRRLYDERRPLYAQVAGATATDVDGVLLASLAIRLERGQRPSVDGPVALIADQRVLELHPLALDGPTYTVSSGEPAKTLAVVEGVLERLQLGRDGTIVAFGGGSTTDVAGFVAATHLRGVRWLAAPTTLVGQVDAAIGGKTGINLATGKNLAGAFHFPQEVLIDPDLLATLPDEERRSGLAEVVKTGLLAGNDVWTLPEEEMIRACAAFKAAVVISDPQELRGPRRILNLGHTFAHALEAGSGYTVTHGEAVALGLLAALRLSGQATDVVDELLSPEPVQADPDTAWAALKRDKKGEGVFVLLEGPGRPVVTTVSDEDARAALNALIRQ